LLVALLGSFEADSDWLIGQRIKEEIKRNVNMIRFIATFI